jgi:elongation factor G
MFGYVDALRSLTSGRGNYTMHFGAYTRIPAGILQPLLLRLRGY